MNHVAEKIFQFCVCVCVYVSLIADGKSHHLTVAEDGELGHHGHFVWLSVSCSEASGFGVLGLETGLPQAFEVNGVYSHQTSQSRIEHIRLDKTGNMAWRKKKKKTEEVIV